MALCIQCRAISSYIKWHKLPIRNFPVLLCLSDLMTVLNTGSAISLCLCQNVWIQHCVWSEACTLYDFIPRKL